MTEEMIQKIVLDTITKAGQGPVPGWVSMMFAAIVFGGLISLGLIVYKLLEAYFDLQKFVRTELMAVITKSNEIHTRIIGVISHAPCWKEIDKETNDA